ncbi:MAG: hypothetical protein CVU56_09245 [Deltaproteobacteria bacterium HGW-Deltaproteobacteria-14]|nr:MAG: hypothetical protein CVU56_09245 [Deltaproteobacteria bacterium HGW-Deltaproteobacteria-14]
MIALLLALVVTAHPAGWHVDDLDAALAAVGPDGILLVDVGASWCAPCHQLTREVLDTPAGAALTAPGDAGLSVDFDSPAGQAIAKRLAVISLPTTLVLDAHGGEVGRVEGYPGRDAWLEAVADARAGRIGLDALAARAAADPKDLDATIDLAWARLVRAADPAAAPASIAALERVIRSGGAAGARAGRVLGRWYLRVQGDAPRAVKHFAGLVRRFRETPYAAGFRYWLAAAHHAARDDRAALAVFDRWRRAAPRATEPLAYQADFMVEHGFPAADAERVVLMALARTPDDPALSYLLARSYAARRALAEAHGAIDRAITLAPDVAIYSNFKKNLPYAPAPQAPPPGADGGER